MRFPHNSVSVAFFPNPLFQRICENMSWKQHANALSQGCFMSLSITTLVLLFCLYITCTYLTFICSTAF